MITGFNNDIEHGGWVFHVQTEEKGLDNPVVVTLVYCGGEIVTSMEASYADLIVDESAPESEDILRRMSEQHEGLIRQIRRGRFTPPPTAYGHNFLSSRSLDELVLGYLEERVQERQQKVGRVLNKLARILAAAEQAYAKRKVATDAVEVEGDVEAEQKRPQKIEPVVPAETPAPLSEPVAPTRERRKRGAAWLWAGLAAAILVGLGALRGIGILGGKSGDSDAAVPLVPVVESSETTADVQDEERAALSILPGSEPVDPEPGPEARTSVTVGHAVKPTPEPPTTVVEQPSEPTPQRAAPTEPDSIAPQTDPEPVVPSTAQAILPEAGVDVDPMPSQRDLPRYTRRARRLQQEGLVKLKIHIDSQGAVSEVVLVQGIPGSDLNDEAIEVARDWTFSPARKDGERVAVWKDVTLEFVVRPDRTTSVRIHE